MGHQIWAKGGWVTWVIWCFANKLCMDVIHEWAHCCEEAANHQLPIAAAFWIIQIVSTKECSSLMQNLMQIYCSGHSVILNVTATQCTCSLSGIYHPQVKLSLFTHGHSSPFSLAARLHYVAQTILIILTMVGLFLDRPHKAWNSFYFCCSGPIDTILSANVI